MNKIVKVLKNSIGDEIGLNEGDILLKINGSEIEDIFDYKYLICDEYVELEVLKDNEIWEIPIEKEYDEDIGIEFENPILKSPSRCSNNCIFCFVDQLPKGMRKTLYFKDDDSRLSFFQGNFVTLTNMSEKDLDKIIKYKISPINISVHTTNSDLRVKMLKNKNAGNIKNLIEKLSKNNIEMNCQIVLVKGYNDKGELKNTLNDLFEFYPNVKNVAIVPLGITKFRNNLEQLETFSKDDCKEIIEEVNVLQEYFYEKCGTYFARLSDEFYVLSESQIPNSEFYDGYDQLEDGVGSIRYFRDNIKSTIENLKNIKSSITIITSVLSEGEIRNAINIIKDKAPKIDINYIVIKNEYFGETITVSGLIVGCDIINELKNKDVKDNIIIPSNMLKSDEDIFLDDVKVSDVSKELKKNVVVANYTGEDLIDIINDLK